MAEPQSVRGSDKKIDSVSELSLPLPGPCTVVGKGGNSSGQEVKSHTNVRFSEDTGEKANKVNKADSSPSSSHYQTPLSLQKHSPSFH